MKYTYFLLKNDHVVRVEFDRKYAGQPNYEDNIANRNIDIANGHYTLTEAECTTAKSFYGPQEYEKLPFQPLPGLTILFRENIMMIVNR